MLSINLQSCRPGENNHLPIMECKVEKFQSPGKGNGLWATATLSPGELLYIAEPFAYTLDRRRRGQVCENCLRFIAYLLQCSRCKFAKYCSKRCQTEAWPDHKRECKCLQRVPFKEDCDPIRLLGQIIFKILGQTSPCPSEELYSVSELQSNYETLSTESKNEFEHYRDMLQSYLKAGIPHSSQELANIDLSEYFAKMTSNHFLITSDDLVTVGGGMYPSMSLLNHSCEPNSVLVCKGRQLFLRAITMINIGDEITIAYFDPIMPTEDRQYQMRSKYGCNCDCRRCLTRDKDENMLAGDKQASDETKVLIPIVEELHRRQNWKEMLALCRVQLQRNAGRVPDENIYQLKILYFAVEGCMALNMSKEGLQYGNRFLDPYRLHTSGFSHRRVVMVIKVGILQCQQGKHAESRKTMDEALEIMKISYGMDHPMTQTVIRLQKWCQRH